VLELALQTTLLGLAIAIILALVAALVGPLLIDWSGQRALFETEASRLIGVPVRVTGTIDARLLPSPRLVLHDIAIGKNSDTLLARSLGVEFALGPLMRGEWRAAELRLAGPQISLGLDKSGHVRVPNLAVAFKPDELSIDRLSIEDGSVALNDAASGASVTLGNVSFNGEARSLTGPIKGEGGVTVSGRVYPYRLTVGRFSDESGARVRLTVTPADRALTIDADGALALAGGEPRFEGTIGLSRPVGIGSRGDATAAQTLTQPWRLSGKIKASAQSALVQNVDFLYGSEERGFRLSGVADLAFGAHPRFNAVLSGRQIDVDRAVTNADGGRQSPAVVIRKLAELAGAAYRPALPFQIGIGIDQVTLGGGTVQNLRGDISSSTGSGWSLDKLEFRAPGLTQVRLSGRLAVAADAVAFSGPTEIETSDPRALAGWLEGRNETGPGELRPISVRGDVTVASDKVAVEQLKVDFDRKSAAGRLAYRFPSGHTPARLDAELTATQFNIDAALDFGRGLLAGSALSRPGEMALAADIGRATFAGIEARDVNARVKIDGAGLQIDRLAVADYGGASFAANGRIDTSGPSPRGLLSVDIDTKRATTLEPMLETIAPKFAGPVRSVIGRVGRSKLHATADIAGDDKTTVAQLVVDGDLADAHIDVHSRISGDWSKRSIADIRFDGSLAAPESAPLIALLNLEPFVAAGKGPGQLKLHASGAPDGDMALGLQISAAGLSAQANGTARLFAEKGAKIDGTLKVEQADIRPLPHGGSASILPLAMTARVAAGGDAMKLDDIAAKLGGSSIGGHLSVDNASPRRVGGEIEADAPDGPAFIAWAAGLPAQATRAGAAWNWSAEPFSSGIFGRYSGQVALKLKQARLLPQLVASDVEATLRIEKDDIALADANGHLAGGQLSGQMTFHRGGDGLTARAKISVTGGEASQMLFAAAHPPVRGAVAVTAEIEGAGLSPVALAGSLKGSGKIVLTDGQIAGLDPRVFSAITRAVDQGGVPLERGRISDVAVKSLEGGPLSLKHVEAAMRVAAGQLRIDKVTATGADADLSAAGTLDLTDGTMDARLTLTGQGTAAGARPEIFVSLKGPSNAPARSVDVSALTGWLTLRAIDDQTKRLRTIENAPPQPRVRTAPKNQSQQAPALPAPVEIRPAPAPRNAGRPAASVGPQN
jgi:AsmA-like protein